MSEYSQASTDPPDRVDDSRIDLDRAENENESEFASSEVLQRLVRRDSDRPRYRPEGQIARGGMGMIWKVFDEDLRRVLAMKVVQTSVTPAASSGPSSEQRALSRFVEEAQVTSQLDHPGIVPVHELGLDSEGRAFFTMKLVKGRDLKHVFDLALEQNDGWNETRALGVILKVCEAMAYAHSKGVIHRDLKPGNVMVGNFGEVYVMDWGLARVMGRKDTHDIRLKQDLTLSIHTRRREAREDDGDADSPLVTMDGDVVGTPVYMPPEQARGEVEMLSPRSDVYSIGAMLYHLLARRRPYLAPGNMASSHTILAMVLRGPPEPLLALRRDVPAELVAICEKAMARDPEQRYPDTLALAEDLRAYLEHRVVKAHQTGAYAELKKWVERNTALAAASAALVLALIVGLAASSSLYVEAKNNAERAERNATSAHENELRALAGEELAKKEKERADQKTEEAERRTEDLLRLSTLQDLDDLVEEADGLWPALPENVERYRDWLARAEKLLQGRSEHERKLEELRALALPPVAAGKDTAVPTWVFEKIEDRWWHNQLGKLVSGLEALADPDRGLYENVRSRLAFAETVEERTVSGVEARARWAEALASIGDASECPWYGRVELTPQIGLLPISQDPASGLWEFAHLQTGEPAVRRADGKLVLKEETGIVLVLLPGGKFRMGAQRSDPAKPNYDPQAESDESPVHEVILSSFFLSKYEMTQGQWLRATGKNPSFYVPHNYDVRWNAAGRPANLLFPVEQVSWFDAVKVCAQLELSLPSEAQWEYGTRGETSTPWWPGDDPSFLQETDNFADTYRFMHGGAKDIVYESWNDNQNATAPIGSYAANPFGLHDVHGNVWEWCLDGYDDLFYYNASLRSTPAQDPVAPPVDPSIRARRGGGYDLCAVYGRSSYRERFPAELALSVLGFRPARRIER